MPKTSGLAALVVVAAGGAATPFDGGWTGTGTASMLDCNETGPLFIHIFLFNGYYHAVPALITGCAAILTPLLVATSGHVYVLEGSPEEGFSGSSLGLALHVIDIGPLTGERTDIRGCYFCGGGPPYLWEGWVEPGLSLPDLAGAGHPAPTSTRSISAERS